MNDTAVHPPKLTMYSNKSTLKLVLSTLPLNSLAVIAAELMHNTGGGIHHTEDAARPDVPEDVSDALDSLLTDVLNAACIRLGDDKDPSVNSGHSFMQAVNDWYREPGADSRGWWQRVLGAIEKNRG